MDSEIKQKISELKEQFSDRRTQVCEIEAVEKDGRTHIIGTVLDEATKTAVHNKFLNAQTELNVLRMQTPTWLAVSTTLTGLYNKPGFGSGLDSELKNGQMVELLRVEESWAYVRQPDGYLGWVYRPYLATNPETEPTHLVSDPVAPLHLAPDAAAPLVSRVLGGTAVTITEEQHGWACLKLVGELAGWLPAHTLRPLPLPTLPEAQLRQRLVADAYSFTGVPYLWGGSSAYGIDCSGFAQIVHRLSGIQLPRDADMQFDNGRSVEPPFQPGDLLFFASPNGHRRITHVGVSLGDWQLIHSSRSHNGVYVDNVQEVKHLRETFVGARTFIA
ncbi:NlpC/P60 family protein [Candidatus Leptofilum sp.]|uniref:C40 family peptidase n=1 Tax=Candidatus Leptofilum sp. TaxID=3241576 RepID=UPI003B5A3595